MELERPCSWDTSSEGFICGEHGEPLTSTFSTEIVQGIHAHPDGKLRNFPPLTCGVSTVPFYDEELTQKWKRTVYRDGGVCGFDRKIPPAKVKKRVLEKQKNRCYYCDLEFGKIVTRNRRKVTLKENWDHFVPFSFSGRNPLDNWIAACRYCNGLKGSKMFRTLEDAKNYVQYAYARKYGGAADALD